MLNRTEDTVRLTPLNPFDRFPDGRPRVPDDLLRRMKLVTVEEAWGVLKGHGYLNLGTAIANKTKTGMIIDGGIRDLVRLREIPDIAIFARGVDASAIADVTMTGLNVPIRIGVATVLPGDVVLGSESGLIFIPPHLAQEFVEHSERTRLEGFWGQIRIREGRYTSGQVDGNWTDEMRSDFAEWSKAHPGNSAN